MSNHTILLNITCVLGSIQYNIPQYSMDFSILLNISIILHVILSNTHFNILLHTGEYWFQYYLILPEQLGDVPSSLVPGQPSAGTALDQCQARQSRTRPQLPTPPGHAPRPQAWH